MDEASARQSEADEEEFCIVADEAKFNTPAGVAISPDDTWIAVADSGNHV